MKISKAEYSSPDADNDISTDIEVVLENDGESTVELVKTSVIFLNSEGVTVGGSHDDENDVYIESKETAKINVGTGYMSALGFGEGFDKIKAIIDVQLYRREFHNLGEFEIPKDDKAATFIKKGIDIAGLVKIIGVTCVRSRPDEDGDITVKLTVGIRNISDIYFERVTAKFSIYDQEGAEIDRTDSYNSLTPHSGHILEPGLYTMKAGRLRNCKGRLAIHVHQPVGYQSTDVMLTKEER